jgi:hypothetical protein
MTLDRVRSGMSAEEVPACVASVTRANWRAIAGIPALAFETKPDWIHRAVLVGLPGRAAFVSTPAAVRAGSGTTALQIWQSKRH